jgi:hypothetical protein
VSKRIGRRVVEVESCGVGGILAEKVRAGPSAG